MNVAGRKIVGSTLHVPQRRRESRERALDVARHLQRVAPSCFSTISSRPGPSLITASPIGGGDPSTTVATSPRRSGAPFRDATTIDARSADRLDRRRVRDRQALIRRVEEAAGLQRRRRRRPRASPRRASRRWRAADRDRRAPAAADRAGPRSRRSRRRAPPSGAAGSSTSPASSAPSATASAT